MNDYEKGMPAAHTLFQVKGLALIANARKVGVLLHSIIITMAVNIFVNSDDVYELT